MRPLLVGATLLLGCVIELPGQAAVRSENPWPALAEGVRVRIGLHSQRRSVTGHIARLTPNTLYLGSSDGRPPRPIVREDLTSLDVSRGDGNMATAGTVVGGGAGLAAGILVYSNNKRECRPNDGLCELSNTDELLLIPGLALAGGLVGNLLGRMFKAERWENLSLDGMRARVRPGRSNKDHIGARVAI